MNLPELVVRRPITTTMVFVAIVLLGVFSLGRLAIDLIPEISFPSLNISTGYSGVAPEEIEKLITIPIEQAVSSVSGVTSMESTSQEGSSRVTLRFAWGTDLTDAANQVRANVERVRSRLPDDASIPQVMNFDPSRMPIMSISLSGDMESSELLRLAQEEFTYYLERLDGVAAVSVSGGTSREYRIALDPARLQAYNLTIDQVVQAIRVENFNVPAGQVVVGQAQFSLRSVGELDSVEALGNILVARRNGVKTYLRDIADVASSAQDSGTIIRVNGQPGIILSIQKQSGANTVKTAAAVTKTLDDLRLRYPDVRIRTISDSSIFIRQAVNNVIRSGLFGAVLAALVLLLFLHSLRLTTIISVAIPVSFIASFILIERAGMTLNIMSLGGLALGIGMLVDNSIVVLENIHRHQLEGRNSREAAIIGTMEMTPAIVASTLTTLAVFLPMMFVSGMTGIMFRQLSLMVAFSILCSMGVALTLLPVMSAYLLRNVKQEGGSGVFPRIGRFMESAFSRTEVKYAGFVKQALRHPGLVTITVTILFVGSLLLVPYLGSELMPVSDEGELSIYFSLPTGTRLEVTDEMTRRIEALTKGTIPELKDIDTRVGSGGFGGRGTHSGTLNMVLVSRDQRNRSTDQVVEDLRRRLGEIPGLNARVMARSNLAARMSTGGFGGGSDRISLDVQGYQLPVIRQAANDLVQVLQGVPGIVNAAVSRDEAQPEFIVRVDRDKAADLGLTTTQVASAVQSAVQGKVATQLRIDGDEHPVRVAIAGSEGMLPAEIEALPISVGGGKFVPLRSVASLVQQDSPATIQRLNQQRTVRLTASPEGRDLGSTVADAQTAVYEHGLPQGVTVHFGGEYEEQQRAFRELLTVLLLAVALVYSVMASQFESLFDPLLVMFSVPFALVGVILTLLVTGTPLTTQAFLGLIMLGGIVVNNAIVLISYINMLRERGVELTEAIEQAARTRLRPILMTTGSTILGLLPLALELGEGSEIQSPLARTVIGGLIVSTLVTLVLIPTLYYVSHRYFEKRAQRRKSRVQQATAIVLLIAVLGLPAGFAHAQESAPTLTLDAAIEQAMVNSPKIQSAMAKSEDAESKLRESLAAYKTRASLQGSWQLDEPMETDNPAYREDRSVGLSMSQVLATGSLFNRTNSTVELAKLTADGARQELADVRASVVLNVMSAYVDLLKANAQHELSQRALAKAETSAEEAAFRFGQGMMSDIERDQAVNAVANAQAALGKAWNRRQLALGKLNLELGAEPFVEWRVDSSTFEFANIEMLGQEPRVKPMFSDTDLAHALDRYDLVQLRNQLRRAEITAQGRTNGRAPVFNVTGSVTGTEVEAKVDWSSKTGDTTVSLADEVYEFQAGDFRRSSSFGSTPYWTVGVGVTWPVFDGGVEKEKSRQETLQIQQLKSQILQQEQVVKLDVYSARYAIQEALEKVEVASGDRDLAWKRLQLARERARLGTVTAKDTAEAELAYLQAEQSYREALWDVNIAEARYQKAIGQLTWPMEKRDGGSTK